MRRIKGFLQRQLEKKIEIELASNGSSERLLISSPYIFGYWFYQPLLPKKEVSKS